MVSHAFYPSTWEVDKDIRWYVDRVSGFFVSGIQQVGSKWQLSQVLWYSRFLPWYLTSGFFLLRIIRLTPSPVSNFWVIVSWNSNLPISLQYRPLQKMHLGSNCVQQSHSITGCFSLSSPIPLRQSVFFFFSVAASWQQTPQVPGFQMPTESSVFASFPVQMGGSLASFHQWVVGFPWIPSSNCSHPVISTQTL